MSRITTKFNATTTAVEVSSRQITLDTSRRRSVYVMRWRRQAVPASSHRAPAAIWSPRLSSRTSTSNTVPTTPGRRTANRKPRIRCLPSKPPGAGPAKYLYQLGHAGRHRDEPGATRLPGTNRAVEDAAGIENSTAGRLHHSRRSRRPRVRRSRPASGNGHLIPPRPRSSGRSPSSCLPKRGHGRSLRVRNLFPGEDLAGGCAVRCHSELHVVGGAC